MNLNAFVESNWCLSVCVSTPLYSSSMRMLLLGIMEHFPNRRNARVCVCLHEDVWVLCLPYICLPQAKTNLIKDLPDVFAGLFLPHESRIDAHPHNPLTYCTCRSFTSYWFLSWLRPIYSPLTPTHSTNALLASFSPRLLSPSSHFFNICLSSARASGDAEGRELQIYALAL